MKYLLIIFLMITGHFVIAQDTTLLKKKARAYIEQAHVYYKTDPNKSILYNDSAATAYAQLANKPWQAMATQNIAFAYEEKLKNTATAVLYMEKAKAIWETTGDKKGLANNLKYLGMLYGKQNNYDKAKKYINDAIRLFEEADFKAGVAVSYFDMAAVYEQAGYIDSSIQFLLKNKNYFLEEKDSSRIFLVNNKLFSSYRKTGNLPAVQSVYLENTKLEKSEDIYYQHLLDFYRLCIAYFKEQKDEATSAVFLNKEKELTDKLTREGTKFE